MLVIGLTGGIASGKSTVSSLLSTRHNLTVIDADLLAREVIEPGTSGYKLLLSHWGPDRILSPDGDGAGLNRAAIGDIVFHDEQERKWLNGVVHPRVRKEMVKRVLRAWMGGQWAVVVDVPLLVEAGMWKWVGDIVVVFVNERLQTSRLLARQSNPPLTPTQAQARISSQLPLSHKLNYATSVLDNSGDLSDLTSQVDRLVMKWKKQQGGSSGWWWRVCWLVPPVGLMAGALCLVGTWWRSRQGPRRRARGEVERDRKDGYGRRAGAGERIEMSELNGGRRRTQSESFSDE